MEIRPRLFGRPWMAYRLMIIAELRLDSSLITMIIVFSAVAAGRSYYSARQLRSDGEFRWDEFWRMFRAHLAVILVVTALVYLAGVVTPDQK